MMKKHLIFSFIIILFVTLLLVWISNSRLKDFYHYHTAIAAESTASAASEISRFIEEKKRLVSIFGLTNKDLIFRLSENPDNDELIQQLKTRLQLHFPDYFSFTITRPDGTPFMEDFDGFIGNLCLLDLKEFSSSNQQLPRIHPNSVAYHFDILTNIHDSDRDIILFISFHADVLGNILKSAQTNGHQLLLIDTEASNLIEVTDKGSRINTFRHNYQLNELELARELTRQKINNTRWTAIDLYESSLFSNYRDGLIKNSLSILLLFIALTLIMIFVINRKELLRLEAERHKDEFLSVVSHELRTPITSIYGSLSLLANEVSGELTAESKKLTQIALTNCERLNLLINDLLDIQKIEAGKMDFNFETTRIDQFIHQCIDNNKGYAEKMGVHFELDPDPPNIVLPIDKNRIAQVMANLLSNAAKYGASNDRILVSISKLDNRVRISVTDHGEGIPDSFRHRVFDKFAQSEMTNTRNTNGTGLGLCIVKAIAEEHGGTADFESTPGKGSTFYFDLPIEHNHQ